MYQEGWFQRCLAGLFLPVPIGACVSMIPAIVNLITREPGNLTPFEGLSISLQVGVYYIFLGYIFFGLQSLIYTTLMEFLVLRKISNRYFVLGISTGLGALAGTFPFPGFAVIGLIVGFLVGLILLAMRQSALGAGNT